MSEISKDLQDQRSAGLDPTFSRFLEKKPGYDGPTLTAEDEAKIRLEEQQSLLLKAAFIEAQMRRKTT